MSTLDWFGGRMVTLEKEPDTLLPQSTEELAIRLTEEMKLEGTSNDLEHTTFIRADEGNLLGDGVPGYQTTGVEESNDDEELQMTTPTPRPS